ncbi:MAG: CRTAC1 family protein [bacterium]
MLKERIYFISVISVMSAFTGCTPDDDQSEESRSETAVQLTDITEQVGLNFVHDPGVDSSYFMPECLGSGGAFFDYDNDGDLDIYLINSGPHSKKGLSQPPSPNRLFRQEEDGAFSDVTETSGLGDTGYGMGVAIGDFDNDGDRDVYISNYGPDELYRNNGDGTFSNITKQAGIDNPYWGCSVTFFDYNLDDYLDIYVTNYVSFDPNSVCLDRAGRPDYCGPDGVPGVSDVLFRNRGDGTFVDVSTESNIAGIASKGLGVVSADFNGDALPDLYVANDRQPNQLWLNQGDGTFQDQALMLGAALNEMGRPESGMGVALGDADNDGDLDLFITHWRTESNTFYRFIGDYGYLDNSVAVGLAGQSLPYTGFGTGFFDYDNDGDLDLAVANGRVTRGPLLTDNDVEGYWAEYTEPNFLFENDANGRFNVVPAATTRFSRAIENSRGLAFGDVDNDGDVDLLVANEGGSVRLFRNDVKSKGHWLIVQAVDASIQRDAIGANVTVIMGEKRLSRLVTSGYSYLSSNDPRAHFGLGEATAVDQIEVLWPGGDKEIFSGVTSDQIITLRKGESKSIK